MSKAFASKETLSLKDKVVAITGAGSGIGAALADLCMNSGAIVALSDIKPDGAAERLKKSGARGVVEQLDVSSRDDVNAFVRQIEEQFGRIDMMINNAGVALSATVAEMSVEDFKWVMDINFWGVVHGTQAVLPGMLSRDSGMIVNISSLFGLIGVPTQSAYNASKFAVRGFTESLRCELAETNVKTLCVHPGGIKTNIARNSRFCSGIDGGVDKSKAVQEFDRVARVSPEEAAQQIISAALKGKDRLLIGNDARVLDLVQRGFPVGYSRVLRKFINLGKNRE
ncbi:acetoin dehydrogenase [Hahella sp. CCB-MM4]|uniref:SDR family NAD(P)-dependent oxidoreductase n=1 Tax=Hahella sp. (strain CCB-MM4) TaxID=1926491 RepID=UPI000B9AAC98|nr:SDR family NAD(P)-dependent oxidoreductase [Hahella sp. CCB-MM4]OZG73897.1 acetoin dehydrogenase [Hahella sp. CCB-MM4]